MAGKCALMNIPDRKKQEAIKGAFYMEQLAKITPRTKAIMAVHYSGHPCDMDAIMAIAKKYDLKVIEDVSHAQGGLYKGRRLGTIGDVGAMSLMTGKSFAIGEGGMLVTNDRRIYDYALSVGFAK